LNSAWEVFWLWWVMIFAFSNLICAVMCA
jgi:hypothetical protein